MNLCTFYSKRFLYYVRICVIVLSVDPCIGSCKTVSSRVFAKTAVDYRF